MRIAFSGSHRVGKSTLLEGVADALPQYACVEEPYHLLEEDGYEAEHPPSAVDFAAQLARSIAEIEGSDEDVLFDRCPADPLAYLVEGGSRVAAWVDAARGAMERLDLVVLVPIEDPDRVVLAAGEDREQRRAVDATLQELLLDDDLAPDVLVVHGDEESRLAQVLARIRAPGAPSPVAGVIPAR